MDNIYPIGSIFLTIANVNPSTYFGGTWQKMSGGYLYGVSTNPNNSSYTGAGTQSHTLTINEMPNHKHSLGWGPTGRFIKMTGDNSDENSYGFSFHNGYPGDTSDGYNNTQALPVGGGKGHTHQVAYIGVFIWKRIS